MFETVTVTLVSCPFCGDNNDRGKGVDRLQLAKPFAERFTVVCASCGCQGPWKKTRSAAIRAWNLRP